MKNPEKDIQMLGPQVAMEGTLVFEGTLYMNGHIKGSIESREGTIVVGETAVIHADVFVKNANITGEVKGSVRATNRIELHPPARIYGNINAPDVLIEAGVIFEGKCAINPKKKTEIASKTEKVLAINSA
jgi:cytoskeletal protein CcmA (bactofilin family)